MEHHNQAVAIIAANVRQFYDRKEQFRIFHGSTNSTRQSPYRRDKMIDTSGLLHVLEVSIERKTALVEPNVPMDRLVEETLKYGLIPPVVMEFPGITAGGGFSGTSGESSSFKHGFFDSTTNWAEIVLANGDVVVASEKHHSDLFHGAAGSFGTLGVTTLLELRLIEAKTYVELTYSPVTSISEGLRRIKEETSNDSIDYLDGIMFSLSSGVILTGRLTNTLLPGIHVQRFSRAHDPWFYLHAKKLVQKSPSTSTTIEAIPLVDYLFRYDRGGFWVGAWAYKYFMTPFNRITRWALDRFMHTRVMYAALHASGLSKQYIIQDFALPISTAQEFIEYLDDRFGIYPLWLCPLRAGNRISLHPHSTDVEGNATTKEILLNVGVWGPGSRKRDEFVAMNRRLEGKVRELGGMKWLYAHAYYTKEEFWDIYNRKWYDALRVKYDATSLPSVYDKVKVDIVAEKSAEEGSWFVWLLSLFWTIWPLSGLYGVWIAVLGGDYLLGK